MVYAVTYRKNDSMIIGTWHGSGPTIPSPAATRPYEMAEVTEVTIQEMTSLSYPGCSHLRYKWEAGAVVEVADPRPTIRFTPLVIEVEKDTPDVSMTISLLRADGTVNTNFNDTRLMRIATSDRERKLQLSFSSGVAQVNIPTGKSYELRLDYGEDWKAEAPFMISVYDTEL